MSKSQYFYGLHACKLLLTKRFDQVKTIYCDIKRRDQRIQSVIKLATAQGLSIQQVPGQTLDKLTKTSQHQGIVIEAQALTMRSESQLLDFVSAFKEPGFLVMLDSVQDPHNLGACLRVLEVSGADGLIIAKDKSASLSPLVCKVASGAAEIIPVFQVTNLSRCLDNLRQQGLWCWGLSGDAKQQLYQQDFTGPSVLVLGSEGQGIRPSVAEHCDGLVAIPMFGELESMNVSVACGVSCYEVARQRHGDISNH